MPVARARLAAQLRERALHGRLAANRDVNREFHDPGNLSLIPGSTRLAQLLEDSPERLIKDSQLAVPSTRGPWACSAVSLGEVARRREKDITTTDEMR